MEIKFADTFSKSLKKLLVQLLNDSSEAAAGLKKLSDSEILINSDFILGCHIHLGHST